MDNDYEDDLDDSPLQSSTLRKFNVDLLDSADKRYQGGKTSRKELNSHLESSEENGLDESSDGESSSHEATSLNTLKRKRYIISSLLCFAVSLELILCFMFYASIIINR